MVCDIICSIFRFRSKLKSWVSGSSDVTLDSRIQIFLFWWCSDQEHLVISRNGSASVQICSSGDIFGCPFFRRQKGVKGLHLYCISPTILASPVIGSADSCCMNKDSNVSIVCKKRKMPTPPQCDRRKAFFRLNGLLIFLCDCFIFIPSYNWWTFSLRVPTFI